MTTPETPPFGTADASFQAAGGTAGIERLVDDFYHAMNQFPQAAGIRAMYPEDLTLPREKLAAFLSGWLGGPRHYAQKLRSNQHSAIPYTLGDWRRRARRLARLHGLRHCTTALFRRIRRIPAPAAARTRPAYSPGAASAWLPRLTGITRRSFTMQLHQASIRVDRTLD